MAYLQIAIGFVLLFGGGEFLVRGAVSLAKRLSVSPLLVGATVVAFGTSAPELAVSVRSVLSDHGSLALGSVVGSNIANVLLILGITGLVYPIEWGRRVVLRDATALVVASALFGFIVRDGVTRGEGFLMFSALIALTAVHYWRDRRKQLHTFSLLKQEADEIDGRHAGVAAALAFTGAGIVGIVIGADQLVTGATAVARQFGISEATIGLTLVAIGTSLPELAACAIAAYRKHSDLALGNVIGSNIFNMLGIAGVTAVIRPLPIPGEIADFDLWIMLGAMGIMAALLVGVGRLGRIPAGVLLASYLVWIAGKA